MQQVNDVEVAARELVAIMWASDREPGTGMPTQALLAKFGWERLELFKLALTLALERGWLESKGNFSLLTSKKPS